MLGKNYPEHDINKLFDMFEEQINKGGVSDNCADELSFINKLFASLPPQASSYALMALNGTPVSELPDNAKEITPLYIRLLNLADYLEKVEYLRVLPDLPSTEEIMRRHKMMDSLSEHEKVFATPLLGFSYNSGTKQPEQVPEQEEKEEGNGKLHLMNAQATVFACTDPLKTAVFYENNLGFKATHLNDEKMPHIRLVRDNIIIALVESPVRIASPVMYELIIYASEPMLLYHELKSAGVKIIEELKDAKESKNELSNRQFVFEDNDGRRICVSQSTEII